METIPEEFKCTATGNLMDDPFTCDDGYTYDKNSIENLCHMISSKTCQKITTMIPNRALKASIDRFKQEPEFLKHEKEIDDIPQEFKCSITGYIMNEPVTCDDGFTYDRYSIEILCHMVSAKTFKKITTMIPNRALKASIDRFKQDKIDFLIKELDLLLKRKQEKEETLQLIQDQLFFYDKTLSLL